VDSRTSDVSIFMCSGGVRWILVMFDVMTRLLCWIVICMLHFLLLCMCCIFYMPGFGGSPAGEADKIGNFFKKILCSSVMFISSPRYMFLGWLRNVSLYMFLGFGLRNVKSNMFLGFGPRNVRSDMFLGFDRET
jgi:hypothetical protein